MDVAEAEGARIRARIRWIEEGETSTAFFFRKERKQSADRWIPALRDPGGAVYCDVEGSAPSFSIFTRHSFLGSPVIRLLETSSFLKCLLLCLVSRRCCVRVLCP